MPKLSFHEHYFNIEQIKEAVDIVIGDDGFRSNEVVQVLKKEYNEHLELQADTIIQSKIDKARGK